MPPTIDNAEKEHVQSKAALRDVRRAPGLVRRADSGFMILHEAVDWRSYQLAPINCRIRTLLNRNKLDEE